MEDKDQILLMLIIGGYSFADCAAQFDITIGEVKAIYLKDLEEI